MATPPSTLTTRERLRLLVESDPTMSLNQMAEATGVSRQRCHDLLEELGYKFSSQWVKTGPLFLEGGMDI